MEVPSSAASGSCQLLTATNREWKVTSFYNLLLSSSSLLAGILSYEIEIRKCLHSDRTQPRDGWIVQEAGLRHPEGFSTSANVSVTAEHCLK